MSPGRCIGLIHGHDVTFASPLQSTGGSLTKLGSGTLTLTSATNSYDGATLVQGGVLQIDGNLSDVTGVDVASSATYVANSSDTIGSISGDGVIDIALGETLNVGGTSDFSFDGSFVGDGRLRKDGSSTLTLSGDNTNAAVDFEIAEGALALGSANAISIDSLASTSEDFSGGELRFNQQIQLTIPRASLMLPGRYIG